jgi:hypothetical protein
MDFSESKKILPKSLMDLYEQTLSLNTPSGWNRLLGCIRDRMQEHVNRKRELNKAAANLIESARAYITIEEKIARLPKTHKDILDLTFEAGATHTCWQLDKTRYETLSEIYKDLDIEWQAMLCFSETIREQMIKRKAWSDTYRDYDKPIYSGPQNPPQRPSASPLLPTEESECWCVWCEQVIPKPKDASPLSKCEDFAHKCKDGEMRMLTTKIRIAGDTRGIQRDRDFKGQP